jgi:type IV pilus assembly protein PilP
MAGLIADPRPATRTRAAALRLPLAVAVALLLVGCGRGTSDLERYVTEVKSRPGPPLEPLPVMQQFETFEYDAQHLRDPFSAPDEQQATASGSGPRPDPDRRKEALEMFPLDSLDMVGTLGSGTTLVGLIMDPDRVIHRVQLGNYMGQNDGRIMAIHEDRIELVELVSDGAGGWIERDATVALDDE